MVKAKTSFFESVEAEIVNQAKTMVKDKIKSKAIQFGEISALVILAGFLIAFGIANLIGTYFPQTAGGFNYLILGGLFLIIGYLMK